jgi:GT2 family glycosyltransferase
MHFAEKRVEEKIAAATAPRLSIASVTVVYNGAGVLQEHLDSLKRQSRKLEEIIVVDNASTDRTREMLAADYPEVAVLSLPENVGIAGGLSAGISYATAKRQHDWVWLFDQDSVPADDALEQLLAARRLLHAAADNIAILAPVCMNRETRMVYPGLSWGRWGFGPVNGSADQPVHFVDMVISSGSLLRREAVEKVGLPRADFFMDFVDYDHCLRLRRNGYQIAIVRDSILDHAIGAPTTFNILGRTKSWADHDPWREYYIARNETFTIWQHYPSMRTKAFVLYRMAQHAFGVLLFGKKKIACFRMMVKGFFDGRAGRLGIRFTPGKLRKSNTNQPTSELACREEPR